MSEERKSTREKRTGTTADEAWTEVLRARDEARAGREEENAARERDLMLQKSLESALKQKNVMDGKVVGVEDIRIGGTDTVAAAVLLNQRIKVSIPYDEMYTSQVMDMSTVDLETAEGRRHYLGRQRQMLAKVIGLKLSLILTEIIPDAEGKGHDRILGSRKQAAEKLTRNYFMRIGPETKEGETCYATVLSVSPHSLAATFKGIDFVIQQHMLTNRYLIDLQTHYRPGDRIAFVMQNLKRNGDRVTFRANTLAAELEEMRSRWYMISVNTVAKAVITRVRRKNPNSRIDIYAYLPDYDFACKISRMSANDFGREIVSGDEVQVVITDFKESGYLEARIRSLHGNAGLFTNF